MNKLLPIALLSISCQVFAFTNLSVKGCYEVSGRYLGYKNGIAELQVEPGRRGEHILHIKEALRPKNLVGLKVKAKVLVEQTGITADFAELEGRGLKTLTPRADIFSSWTRVGDEDNCKHY